MLQQELAQCKAKLAQLSIKDMTKVLPLCKLSTSKNDVFFLNDLIEKYDFDEERERDEVRSNLRVLRIEVSRFMKELKSYSNSQDYLNKVETMSTNIQNTVADFKIKMSVKFEDFVAIEEQLSEELQNIEQKIDNYEVQVKPPLPKRKAQVQNETVTELGLMKQKIEKIEEKIDRIELLNAEDHREFLRIRTKHKGKYSQQFVNDCMRAIPLLTEDQLEEQVNQYNQYLVLEEEKKQLLIEYKKAKDEIKQAQIQNEIQSEQLRQLSQKKKQIIPAEEREKQKEDLKQWKIKRNTQKVVEEIQQDQTKEQKLLKQEQLRKEQELKKYVVEQYKEQKQQQKIRDQELSQMETMSRRFVSQEAVERIKQKEEKMVERKRMILEQQKQKELIKEMKQQANQEDKYIKYAYVESKLTEPTKAAEQHKRQKFDPKLDHGRLPDTFGGNLLGAGRRAVPGWRQNL